MAVCSPELPPKYYTKRGCSTGKHYRPREMERRGALQGRQVETQVNAEKAVALFPGKLRSHQTPGAHWESL